MTMDNQNLITRYMTQQTPKRRAEDDLEEEFHTDEELLSASEQRNPRNTRKRANNASHNQHKQRHSTFDQNRYKDLMNNDNEIEESQPQFNKPSSFPPIVITQKLVNIKSTFKIIKSWVTKL